MAKQNKDRHVRVSGLTEQKIRQISTAEPKRTMERDDSRSSDIQQIENTYEFYTRQRPLNFTPLIAKGSFPLVNTDGFQNSEFTTVVKEVSQGQALIIHSLRVSARYFTESPIVSYNVQNLSDDALDFQSWSATATANPFYYNLVSSSNSMYEANVIENWQLFTGPTTKGVGLSTLNQNVFDFGGDGGTTLFVPENSTLTFLYSMTLSNAEILRIPPTGNQHQVLAITYEVKGHMMTMKEYEILRTLNQKTDILGLLV